MRTLGGGELGGMHINSLRANRRLAVVWVNSTILSWEDSVTIIDFEQVSHRFHFKTQPYMAMYK